MNIAKKRRMVSASFLLFFILCIAVSRGYGAGGPEELFLTNLKDYFYSYYSLIKDKTVTKPKEDILTDINGMILKYLSDDIENKRALIGENFNSLSVRLDNYLKKYGKSISIFTIGNSEIVNCWLGDIVEEKRVSRRVWGKDIICDVKVIDRSTIQDFSHFSSSGKDILDVGMRDDVVYYNLEAYRNRAGNIWDFFKNREGEDRHRRYESSRSNRLRRRLYYKVWLSLYSDCVKNNKNAERAKEIFVDKAVILLKEASLIHEIGHIFAERYLRLENNESEEVAAFLTELKYGSLPYESLDIVVSAAYQSSMSDYNLAGKEILSSFISRVKEEQRRGNAEYAAIETWEMVNTRKMGGLFKLTEEQIRRISDYIYKQKYEKETKEWQRS